VIIVVMGVSGAGKSTLGEALAERLGWAFIEADDFHPPANVEKMRAGRALDDADRIPWLTAVNAELRRFAAAGTDAVLACSALRRSHRQRLAKGVADLRFVHLHGDAGLLAQRLRQRPVHFMPATLLDTQLATLEPPVDALSLSADLPTAQQVRQVIDTLAVPAP
jgi:gluconokinase